MEKPECFDGKETLKFSIIPFLRDLQRELQERAGKAIHLKPTESCKNNTSTLRLADQKYLQFVQKEKEEGLFSSILVHRLLDPDPRAFLVCQVFEACVQYEACSGRLEDGVCSSLQKLLPDVLFKSKEEAALSNTFQGPVLRSKYWLFFRVLETFILEKNIPAEFKSQTRLTIRDVISSSQLPSLYRLPFQLVRTCCSDYSSAQWRTVARKEFEGAEEGLGLSYLYNLGPFLREVEFGQEDHKELLSLSYDIVVRCDSAIELKRKGPASFEEDFNRMEWVNIQSEWLQTFLLVLSREEAGDYWEGEHIDKYLKGIVALTKEEATIIDLLDVSDLSLFRSLIYLAHINHRMKKLSIAVPFKTKLETVALFGVLVHRFDYSSEFFLELILSSEASAYVIEYLLLVLKASVATSTFPSSVKRLCVQTDISKMVECFQELARCLNSPGFIFNAKPLLKWIQAFIEASSSCGA